VCRISRGQQRHVFGGVAPRKAGPLRQALFDVAMFLPATDQPRHLCPAQSRDLGSEAPHDTAFALLQLSILLARQQSFQKLVDGLLKLRRQLQLSTSS
jgi:hypothetical protein